MKKKNWFFIILLSIAALSLAGTAAYFSVFGLSKLFYAAGLGITILAASLEFAKIVTVSYVYRFWKTIKKFFRFFYVFAVVFIMFLTSVGIYGFLTGAYQQSANKLEMRDSQIRIADNKKTLFVAQLDRINKSIQSSGDRINLLSGLRTQQENRLDKRTSQLGVKVITSTDEQIKILNQDITDKMSQTNVVNDSIAFYDQKIANLKISDVSNEVGPYKFVADLTGIPMNKVVNIVALLIILVFDPLAIALLIGVNQLTMGNEDAKKEEEIKIVEEKEKKEKTMGIFSKLIEKIKRKPKVEKFSEVFENKQIDEPIVIEQTIYKNEYEPVVIELTSDYSEPILPIIESIELVEVEPVVEPVVVEPEVETVVEPEVETVVEPVVETQPRLSSVQFVKNKEYNEFEPQQIASVSINTAQFIPNQRDI